MIARRFPGLAPPQPLCSRLSRGRVVVSAALVVALAPGCSEPRSDDGADSGGSSEGAGGPSQVILLVEVPNSTCDAVGVVEIEARARRVGCESPPPAPCTLPAIPVDILGDKATCPISDPNVRLGVTIDDPGRYLVDTVARRDGDDPITSCFAATPMATEVLVTTVDLEIRAEKSLMPLGVACPEP